MNFELLQVMFSKMFLTLIEFELIDDDDKILIGASRSEKFFARLSSLS